MEKLTETFNPVYKQIQQIKDCVPYMSREQIIEARVAIVVGHNGRNFVTSTDWRLTTESGESRVLTFTMRPQYPNFVECIAGVEYGVRNEMVYIHPDKLIFAKSAEIHLNGQIYTFNPREALKIYVEPGNTFIATDCLVNCIETETKRIYHIVTDENTLFGKLDKDGSISQVL